MMNTPKVPNGNGGALDPAKNPPEGRPTAPMPAYGGTAAPSNPDGRLTPQPMKTLEGVAEQAKHAAETLVGQTKEKVASTIASGKDKVADRSGNVADAIREAGEKLGGHDGGALPEYAGQAADQIERLTKYVRSRNVGQLVGDVETFARKEPLIFFGSAFTLGLLAARFVKSSARRADGGAAEASKADAKPSHTTQPHPTFSAPQGASRAGGTRPGAPT